EPAPIAPRHRRAEHSHGSHRWIVDGVASAVERSADTLSMFSEQPVAWAAAAGGGATSVELAVTGRVVATYELAPHLEPVLAPRPFLHPVRSLGGAVTSDCQPPDHPWHLGVGVAIQDVGGVNCWGGRTYDRHHGYLWRDDHGTVRHVEWVQRSAGLIGHTLAWMGPDHQCRLVEERTITAQPVGGATDRWVLGFRFALRNVSGRPLALGSPGSNGRVGGGYGGFFWRLARAAGRREVCTDRAVGEQAVHGQVAPWVAWTQHGREPAGPGDGAFTLMVAPADGQTAADPWFVRLADYPGIGSALAWDEPVVLAPGEIAARSVRALVVDGTGHDLGDLYDQLARATTSTNSDGQDHR
ncbi:MAG: PmoA family protein, partial [Acidimicrobiales bacterium]